MTRALPKTCSTPAGTAQVYNDEGALLISLDDSSYLELKHTRREIAAALADFELRKEIAKRPGKSAYLTGIEVGEAHRGRGVGSALMQCALSAARALKVQRVFLHAHADREQSGNLDRFYQRHGFKRVWCCPRDVFPVYVSELGTTLRGRR